MAKKNQSQTEFAYPVDKIHGKISRHSKVVHACTANGLQITYLQGKRDLLAHPESQGELSARELFKRRQDAVAARVDRKAESYAADYEAYRAQYKDGIKTFRGYLWSVVKAEIVA